MFNIGEFSIIGVLYLFTQAHIILSFNFEFIVSVVLLE